MKPLSTCYSEEYNDKESRPSFLSKEPRDEILRRKSKDSLLSVQ